MKFFCSIAMCDVEARTAVQVRGQVYLQSCRSTTREGSFPGKQKHNLFSVLRIRIRKDLHFFLSPRIWILGYKIKENLLKL